MSQKHMNFKRLNPRGHIRQCCLIPSHDPPRGPHLIKRRSGAQERPEEAAVLRRWSRRSCELSLDCWVPESAVSMARAYCFLGCLLLAAGVPLDAAKRERFSVSVFNPFSGEGLCAGPSGVMPSEPELDSVFGHFFWKPLGMLEPQQNASSSILCFRLIETNNRAASL